MKKVLCIIGVLVSLIAGLFMIGIVLGDIIDNKSAQILVKDIGILFYFVLMFWLGLVATEEIFD